MCPIVPRMETFEEELGRTPTDEESTGLFSPKSRK